MAIKFPVKVQMDGRIYTVEKIRYPKQVGEPWAIATVRRGVLGETKVQSMSTQIRLARRVLEAEKR